ncbi:DUF4260 domain-containing protein [Maribacter thermophilus]|uniref:DUF4260 domain-containing protein n=1 Tax=Maribacter thermophilus TaxID=1197874 RepID=UPI0006411D44|nr:DUF4260 domain-containing protein [Maribacter thermophilus]
MKNLLRLEELAMFVLGIFMFGLLGYQWWLLLVLLLTPDIGMLGYLVNNKLGAGLYNLFHHKGVAILLYFFGMYFSMPIVQLAGVILFSHSAMDRMFGYGLKYEKGFKFTHLGEIGKNNG